MARNYTGGDLEEIVVKHPDLGEYRFHPKSNESANIDGGGYRSSDDSNGITANGSVIRQINRVRWSVETNIAIDMEAGEQEEVLRNLAGHPTPAEWVFASISGMVRRGKGFPVGDLIPDHNTSTMSLKITGGGSLEVI